MESVLDKLISMLETYGIDSSYIRPIAKDGQDTDYVYVGDILYHVPKKLDDRELEDLASYINANSTDIIEATAEANAVKEAITNPTLVISESLSDIEVGKIYKYEPQGIDFNELEDKANFEQEAELFEIAKHNPYCKVQDKLIVSKEEDDGFLVVTFDIPENGDLGDLVDIKNKDFVVFESDLKSVEETEIKESVDDEDEEVIELVNDFDYANYTVESYIIEFDGEIVVVYNDKEENVDGYYHIGNAVSHAEDTLEELNKIATDPKYYITQELYDAIKQAIHIEDNPMIKESLCVPEEIELTTTSDETNTSTSLLTALNSEKEAVMVYEMLLKLSVDEQERELLTKILNDEKEHIALLSSLQTKQVADFVAEDNKETLDENAQDVIDTPAMTE